MTAPKPPEGFVHYCGACGEQWVGAHSCRQPPFTTKPTGSTALFFSIDGMQKRIAAQDAELAALRAELAEALNAAREFQADAKRVAERNALLRAVAKEAVTANSCALIDPADSTRYEDLEERLNNAINAARAGGAM